MSESVQVYRGETDNKGNSNKVYVGTAVVTFAWSGTRKVGSFSGRGAKAEHAESYSSTATVFADVGEDIRSRDRIVRSNGDRYYVAGVSTWGEDNMFGYDENIDGVQVFMVESVNG